MLKLDAKIKKVEAAIASELDPRKRAPLQSTLAVLMAAKAEMDDDDGDHDEPDGDDGEDESKAKKAAEAAKKAAKKAEAAKHRAKAAEYKQKMAEYEEKAKALEEEKAPEEGGEEAAIAAAATLAAGSDVSPGAAASIAAQAQMVNDAVKRIEALERSLKSRERAALVEAALVQRRITPAEAKTLGGKDLSFVTDFLAMRPNPVVAAEETALAVPTGTGAGALPDAVMSNINAAVSATVESMGDLTAEQRRAAEDKIRSQMVEAKRKQLNGAANKGI